MEYFHDMVGHIHQKRIWRPWNQCGSLERTVGASEIQLLNTLRDQLRCRHGEQLTPVWRSSISHAQSPTKTGTRILATGGGGDCDTCHQDNVVTWQVIRTAVALDWNYKLLLMGRLLVAAEKNCGIMLYRDQTWLCVYCLCQTPEGVVSPRRAITRAQPNNTHTIMFDPLIIQFSAFSLMILALCDEIQCIIQ